MSLLESRPFNYKMDIYGNKCVFGYAPLGKTAYAYTTVVTVTKNNDTGVYYFDNYAPSQIKEMIQSHKDFFVNLSRSYL